MNKDKKLWYTNKEIPKNGSCVLWKAKLFSKERGNIEGGRYDKYYDCFCGTASLFLNRSNIKQWIYCKDVFDILDQNTRLQSELDKQIKDNRKLVKAVKSALNFLACPDVIDEDTCNEQLAFDELRNVLKEVGEEE